MSDSSVSFDPAEWLLLVHQLPVEPAYLRVKVSRRLKRLGALPLRGSVYVLPATEEAREDFAWVRREIVEGGGEGTIIRGVFLDGMTGGELRVRFSAERDAEYAELAEEVRASLREGSAGHGEVRRYRARLEGIAERDFFDAGGRFAASQAVKELEALVLETPEGEQPAMKSAPTGGTWVTRRGIRIDRMASAWLIRRFIDPGATFRFVAGEGYEGGPGEVRFDMYEGEFTHEGDRCTFETLVARFGLTTAGLREISEIVHDLDFKDEKFGRPEAAGIAGIVAGIAAAHEEDEARLEAAMPVMDALLAGFGKASARG